MSLRTIIVIGLALFCGFSASIGISHLGRTTERPVEKPVTVPVVVAKAELTRGKVVTEQMVEVKAWPKDLAPANAVTKVEQVADRVAVATIEIGEPLSLKKLASKDSGRGLSALIPPGMRAYTIKISNVASNVAGFIVPGSRVDVLLTLRGGSNDETGGGTTVTLLQAVEVLAVDQELETPDQNPKGAEPRQSSSVTLLISPDQAPVLDLGQNMGILTLSLRNPSDTDQATTQPATLNELRYMQRGVAKRPDELPAISLGPPPKEDEPQIFEIRTLRGNSVGRVRVIKPR